jgi:hypothetical protein
MKNRNDDLLRTNAWQHPIDKINVGRYHISAPLLADTDGILTATKRTKTTAWVASNCTVKAASAITDTLTVTAPAMLGAIPNALKIDLLTADDDVLAVSAADEVITISLADTTAGNNTAAKIQAAIRALGTVNGIDVSAFTCAAGGNWDTAAVATGETDEVAFANGVTGDYDVIIFNDLVQPAEPRNITAKAGGTAGDVANVAVKIFGTDFNDEPIEEELPYFTANTATSNTAEGTKAFKTVTAIWLPAHDGANATTEIGFGSLLGLPYKLTNKCLNVAFGGAWEASAPTVQIDADVLCKNTIQIVGTLDGEKDVDIYLYL